jgi:lysophospholipase L1-like esterase
MSPSVLPGLGKRTANQIGALGRRAAILLGGCVAALVVAEYGTRIVLDRTPTGAAAGEPPAAAAPRIVNSLGFREREIGPKRVGTYRIAVVGDSYTWGQGLADDERFSNVLGNLLGPRYDVLNFGVPGHAMLEHLQELDLVLKLSPDFILLQMYINNFETPSMRRPDPMHLLPHDLNARLNGSSVVYQILNDRFAQLQEALGFVDSYDGYLARHLRDPDSPDAQQAFGWLREFFQRAQAAGVPSGAVLFPAADAMGAFGSNYPFQFLHEHVQTVCAQAQVRCLDLLPLFASLPDPRTTWINPTDAHPNAVTNRRAAVAILTAFGAAWRQ